MKKFQLVLAALTIPTLFAACSNGKRVEVTGNASGAQTAPPGTVPPARFNPPAPIAGPSISPVPGTVDPTTPPRHAPTGCSTGCPPKKLTLNDYDPGNPNVRINRVGGDPGGTGGVLSPGESDRVVAELSCEGLGGAENFRTFARNHWKFKFDYQFSGASPEFARETNETLNKEGREFFIDVVVQSLSELARRANPEFACWLGARIAKTHLTVEGASKSGDKEEPAGIKHHHWWLPIISANRLKLGHEAMEDVMAGVFGPKVFGDFAGRPPFPIEQFTQLAAAHEAGTCSEKCLLDQVTLLSERARSAVLHSLIHFAGFKINDRAHRELEYSQDLRDEPAMDQDPILACTSIAVPATKFGSSLAEACRTCTHVKPSGKHAEFDAHFTSRGETGCSAI